MYRLCLLYLHLQAALCLSSEELQAAFAKCDVRRLNPEETGGYLEGDILYAPKARNGILDVQAYWKDGVIPYVIDEIYNTAELSIIKKAMEQYHQHTCIRFRTKKAEDQDYIYIESKKEACFSSIGRIGGRQAVNLHSGCFSEIGKPIHELMHAVGFYHEHNRYERDDYVKIVWDNIKEDKLCNFKKESKEVALGFGVAYDYGSVLHYGGDDFTKNGKATIVPKKKGVQIGQRKGFSVGDIEKINKMYHCKVKKEYGNATEPAHTTKKPASLVSGFVDMIFG